MAKRKKAGQALDLMSVTVTSARLSLEPLSLNYLDEIFSAFTPEITQYMGPESPAAPSETEAFILNALRKSRAGTDLHLVILDKGSKEFLGGIGLHSLDTSTPELGLWLKKAAHGRGYGLEATAALAAWAKAHFEFESLVYKVSKENTPSRRIPERLGGSVLRECTEIKESGVILNQLEYRIPREAILQDD